MEENWAEIYTCLASWLPLVFNKWIVSRSSSLWVLYEPRGHAFTLILRNRFSALRALCGLPILPALPPSLAGNDDSFCCLYVYTFIRMSHSGKQTLVLSDTVISVCGFNTSPMFSHGFMAHSSLSLTSIPLFGWNTAPLPKYFLLVSTFRQLKLFTHICIQVFICM